MKKMPKKWDTVCMNGEPDATVYRVMDLDGFNVGMVEAAIDPHKETTMRWVDRSLVERATRAQLQNAGLV